QYEEFADQELKALADALKVATTSMFEVRKFGDIHNLSESDATKRGEEFMKGYQESLKRAVTANADLDKATVALDAARVMWKKVKPALSTHTIDVTSDRKEDNF